jgi:hypothetical protein
LILKQTVPRDKHNKNKNKNKNKDKNKDKDKEAMNEPGEDQK